MGISVTQSQSKGFLTKKHGRRAVSVLFHLCLLYRSDGKRMPPSARSFSMQAETLQASA